MRKKVPSSPEDGDDSMMYIYRSYITTKTGKRIYPQAYGLKAFRFRVKQRNKQQKIRKSFGGISFLL